MDYKSTVQNFRHNLSVNHLVKYEPYMQEEIIERTIFIYSKAVIIASYNWLIRKPTPKSRFENESNIYKAWFCYIVATEILRRDDNKTPVSPDLAKEIMSTIAAGDGSPDRRK